MGYLFGATLSVAIKYWINSTQTSTILSIVSLAKAKEINKADVLNTTWLRPDISTGLNISSYMGTTMPPCSTE